jgi:hypothetical protein
MTARPKRIPSPAPPPPRRPERTSAVITGTLIFLTALGIVTVFWEPLAAVAVGSSGGAEAISTAKDSTNNGTNHGTNSDSKAPGESTSPSTVMPRDAAGNS